MKKRSTSFQELKEGRPEAVAAATIPTIPIDLQRLSGLVGLIGLAE